ncbi:uncharacterized protein LOC143489319 [Brachyhypopomus gauderio]|uniref:uncharacterized protein LOC143489319 n=1 Tax=Brachyhypopomus gauderio TaxID=698409 RepID=UPI004041BBCF
MVTMNNRHLHRHHQRCHPSSNHGYGDSPSAQNSLNSLLAWSSCTLATCGMAHTLDKIEGKAGQQEVALPNQAQEAWSPEVTGVGFYQGTTLSVPTASFSMEMEKRDAEGEDNIVYL